jgi:CRP-like cAMP-binding protein
MWLATLVDEGVLREWIVNIGARNAKERIAHLMCELLARVKAVGLATGDSFELPITQSELGETMGLSPVHVNRTLKLLRADGLITFKGGQLVVLDAARLRAISSFNSSYLHLEERDQP